MGVCQDSMQEPCHAGWEGVAKTHTSVHISKLNLVTVGQMLQAYIVVVVDL